MGIVFEDDIRMVAHPDAPLIDVVPAEQLFAEAVRIMTFTHLDLDNADDMAIVRNVALGNLFFFLKYIAGFSGPYSSLTPTLHMEMCNWRQEQLREGAHGAGFVPRSTFKSTCWTHGAIAWELVRNPDLRVGIFSCIMDRSLEFMHNVQRTFDDNELMRVVFPEHCVIGAGRRDARWNDTVAVMPNRRRNYSEPSIGAYGVGGSTQGIHVDLAAFDDIVGVGQLTSDRKSSAEMISITNWMNANLPTLLVKPLKSRVTLAATRYAIDDPYEAIMLDAKTHSGEWSGIGDHYPVADDGAWDVYYRSALSSTGESIFPEAYDIAFLQKLSKSDYWTYVTQYVNNPHSVENVEFASFEPRRCQLQYDVNEGEFQIAWDEFGERKRVKLAECDVVAGADPAASDRRESIYTSRSAISVVARYGARVFIVDLRADFVKPSAFFDWLFAVKSKYKDAMRQMRIEAAGPFKFLRDLLRQEELRRRTSLSLMAIPAMGDKYATIRSVFEPLLKRDMLFVADDVREAFLNEFSVFPSAACDILDATKIAIAATRDFGQDAARDDDDDDDDVHNRRAWHKHRIKSAVGY